MAIVPLVPIDDLKLQLSVCYCNSSWETRQWRFNVVTVSTDKTQTQAVTIISIHADGVTGTAGASLATIFVSDPWCHH